MDSKDEDEESEEDDNETLEVRDMGSLVAACNVLAISRSGVTHST